MAIAAGSRVALKNSIDGAVPGEPHFASVISGADPYTILWDNGPSVSSVPATSVDEILAATGGTASTKFVGQQVRVTADGQSGFDRYVVLMVFNRAGADVAWLRNVATGADIQRPVSTLTLTP